jgi:hypothetical protein
LALPFSKKRSRFLSVPLHCLSSLLPTGLPKSVLISVLVVFGEKDFNMKVSKSQMSYLVIFFDIYGFYYYLFTLVASSLLYSGAV